MPPAGHRHQLRAQLNPLGPPIVGDRIYPSLWLEPAAGAAPDYANPLQLLARELAFFDPVSGQPQRFVSRRRLALVPASIQANGDQWLPMKSVLATFTPLWRRMF